MSEEPPPDPAEQVKAIPDALTPLPPQPLAEWPELAEAPPRSVRSFPLHPSFWWALLWCIGLLLFTQVPAGLVAVVVLVVVALSDLDALGGGLDSSAVQAALGLAVVVAHVLIIAFSLLVLRIVAGRDWKRQVALRLPASSHVLLTLAAVPGFVVLGSASYRLIKRGLGFPSMDNLGGLLAFWGGITLALVVFGVGHLLCRVVLGRGWYRALTEGLSRLVKGYLSVVLIVAFVGLAWFGYLILFDLRLLPSSGGLSGIEDLVELVSNWPVVVAVLVVGVMPALSEELWCRAYLGRGLVGTHGVFWGVVMTSFLFGLIHIDPCQGTMAMLMGLVLHTFYLLTRSLLVPMLVHFLNNSLAVVIARIPQVAGLELRSFETPNEQLILGAMLLAAALLLGACLWALYESRAQVVGPAGEPAWQPANQGVALPPEQSDTRVWSPLPSVPAVVAVLVALGLFWVALAMALRLAGGVG
jgi:membrane protease YdiL (CAAX protease family)